MAQQLFERHLPDVPVGVLSWRLGATAPVPKVELHFGGQPAVPADPLKGNPPVYFPETGFIPCPVYSRYALGPGARLSVDKRLKLVIDLG